MAKVRFVAAWTAVGIAFGMTAPASATPSFPESGYTLVYDLSIPNAGNYDSTAVPYTVNNAASITDGSFLRVGYMLEIEVGTGPVEYVAVSMDAFTSIASQLGVPTVASGEIYNDLDVTGMDVESNVAGVTTGTDLPNGFVQFWPDCYGHSGAGYATGDDIRSAGTQCYGSMQIGDGVGNTVFAYNDWTSSSTADLGIGNDPTGSNTDWTFAANATDYTVKDLSIWTSSAIPEPGTLSILVLGISSLMVARRRCRRD